MSFFNQYHLRQLLYGILLLAPQQLSASWELQSNYYFSYNQTAVLEEHHRGLNCLIAIANDSGIQVLRRGVAGNADKTEDKPYDLSWQRAVNIANYMQKRLKGLLQFRIIAQGADLPVAPSEVVEGRAKNRRVDVFFDQAERPEQELQWPTEECGSQFQY